VALLSQKDVTSEDMRLETSGCAPALRQTHEASAWTPGGHLQVDCWRTTTSISQVLTGEGVGSASWMQAGVESGITLRTADDRPDCAHWLSDWNWGRAVMWYDTDDLTPSANIPRWKGLGIHWTDYLPRGGSASQTK
jgi:hypothetical protein